MDSCPNTIEVKDYDLFRIAGFVLIILAGLALRLTYASHTDWGLRGHDGRQHLEYVLYVKKHWSIPPAASGWEMYHPPLYYFCAAGFLELIELITGSPHPAEIWVRWLGQGFALLGMLAAIGAVIQLWPERREAQLMSAAFMVTFPGWILVVSRVSNDALAQPLAIWAVFLGLRWYRRPTVAAAVLWWLVIDLWLLTKLSALPLAAAMFFCIMLRPELSRSVRAQSLLLAALIFAAGWGVYAAYRVSVEKDYRFFGPASELAPGQRAPNSAGAWLTFNPVALWHYPFNDPWNGKFRRDRIWEFLYRSAYFGEFNYNAALDRIARMLETLGLLFLLLGACECLRKIRPGPAGFFEEQRLPLLLIFFSALTSLMFFRFRNPFIPTQDFRYITVALLPIVYFCTQFAYTGKWLQRQALLALMLLHIALSAEFFRELAALEVALR